MNFDFPSFMVACALVTGGIWAADKFWFAKNRLKLAGATADAGATDEHAQVPTPSGEAIHEHEHEDTAAKEPLYVEISRALFPIIVAVLILRSFLVEPFRIPSGSMMPTLLVGDFILVNKYAYGLRLPVINTKILDIGHPQRGDVVVFRYPNDPSVDYIKRVIGLPGDTIRYHNKKLYINGTQIQDEIKGIYQDPCTGPGNTEFIEDLDSVKHSILLDLNESPRFETERVIKEGEYFVMGDNRDNSNDSRRWGTVPEANLVGKAFMVWMNADFHNECYGWSRIGKSIH